MKFLLLLVITFNFISCAKKDKDLSSASGIELAEDELLDGGDLVLGDTQEPAIGQDDGLMNEAQPLLGQETQEPTIGQDDGLMNEAQPLLGQETQEPALDGAPMLDQPTSAPVIAGETREYTVSKNETLMMVAFKVYGDYSKWREIQQLNGIQGQSIQEGQKLVYNAPAQEFNWNPMGEPYLIKRGDTLGIISNNKYGTTEYWKDIWKNNKVLIKNPNKIFAGFTIYTPELPERDVANQ